MLSPVISLPYFGSIYLYQKLLEYTSICIEKHENFQKQTYRNRQYIYGANGKLMLNIPIKHSKSSTRKKYSECEIENSFKWQELHFKSLETAYRTSPYFEFYEDDILPLFTTKYNSLFEYNLACFKKTIELINLDIDLEFTSNYKAKYDEPHIDLRSLISAKTNVPNNFKPYHQVFENKHGFIPNLSILDLLFNLGPESYGIIKAQA